MKVTLLFFSWFYIPLHSGALIPVCFGLFHVQLEIPFRAWCNGFVLWAGHSRDVRVSQAPCAGSQGCLWHGEHGGVCSSGSNGIITWNWAGFVGIVEAIFDPEHANCLTMVFFPPLGLREQRYSVKTCCRYCNVLNMGFFLMFCCDVWAFRGLWSTLMWGKNTALVRDGTLDVFDFSAHKKTRDTFWVEKLSYFCFWVLSHGLVQWRRNHFCF